MPRSEGELVGRAPELARLADARCRLAHGPVVVELVGEPGMGKTSLLDVLGEQMDAAGGLVFTGRAAEFEQDTPYAPFVDALDAYLPTVDLTALGPRRLAGLAAVFPALPPAPPGSRRQAYRAVGSLLELLAAERPVVLALDDMHWADAASAELLLALLRAPPRASVLLVLAHRPFPPRRLCGALDRAAPSGLVERVELGPLDDAAAAQLVAALVRPGQDCDALVRECGGNPFHLLELARNGGDVPRTVAELVLEEVEQLGADPLRLLQGAGIVGDPFDLDLAAAAAGLAALPAPDHVDALIEANLVRPTDVPRAFRFRHPLVRRIVREHTGPGWTTRAHGRIAAALESAGAPPAMRARHVAQAAALGDRAAAALLVRAAADVAARAPDTAAQWYADALRLLPHAPSAERAALLARRAIALEDAGRLVAARAALHEILALSTGDGATASSTEPVHAQRAPGPPNRRVAASELTERERAVAALVAEGRTNREIGVALHLAEKTVERHVSRVLGKLGARTRAAVGGLLPSH
jgi:DNA-binding CsgD family transcriptional regulator